MHFPTSVLAVLILAGAVQADDSDKSWQIQGQVVDEQGVPVDDFDAAGFWSSNGKQWDETGEWIKVSGLSDAGKFWKEEGTLAAHPKQMAKRLPEGRFSLSVNDRPRVSVFAVDKRHERGGFVSVEKSAADKPVRIMLVPLVRVTAKVYCSEAARTPDWSIAVIHPPGDRSNYLHFTQCGSVRGEISLLLPPGKYDFDVYSESPDASMRRPKHRKGNDTTAARLIDAAIETLVDLPVRGIRVEVPHGKDALDLGVLNVALPKDKDGIARDYSSFYGKEPPELAITDARGVPKGVKLADFRGKWVLLDFWAVWCGPCVARSLPELTTFYEEHAADRNRFEILAICNTEGEKAQTIAAYDAIAAPIVEKVWEGKQLPFPVLIDGEGKTSGVYGIQSWPTVLLIDPEGHLVKNGDKTTLAEKLKESSLAERIAAIGGTHRQREKQFRGELHSLAKQQKDLGEAEYKKQISRSNKEYYDYLKPVADELIALIKANRQDPAVMEGLILLNSDMSYSLAVDEQLIKIALEDQFANPKMGRLCSNLRYANNDLIAAAILQAVAEKHPARDVRGMATYALGEYYRQTARNDWGRPMTPEHTAKLLADADKQFVNGLENYADVKSPDGESLRSLATSTLMRVRNIPNLTVGKPAPEVRGEAMDGSAINLADYRGKVVLIVFWGSWCGPCMRMVPHERELVERWKGKPFVLLGVNCGDDRETAKRTMAAKQMHWISLWDGESHEGPVQSAFNVLHWPTVYVVDAKGTIRAIEPEEKELDSAIEKLLAETEPPSTSAN